MNDTPTAIPHVLIIDDNEDTLSLERDEVNLLGKVFVTVLHPRDVSRVHLAVASLILVDYVLESWPERGELQCISLQPATGLALISILQEHSHRIGLGASGPCAFALHTGKADLLRHTLANADHLVARTHNLDWVFSKRTDRTQRWNRIIQLACAVHRLPGSWSVVDHAANFNHLCTWLDLSPERSWARRAFRDIEDCHPPTHELAAESHGDAIIRWMLHRILPYPCFLLDMHHLAARFRVSVASLREALEINEFKSWIDEALYSGELSNFLGLRWWRSGVEKLIYDLVMDDPANGDLLVTRLRVKAPCLESCPQREPVVVVDEDYSPIDQFCDLSDALHIAPDDWPPFAEFAWASIESVKDSDRLRAILVAADREKVNGDSNEY